MQSRQSKLVPSGSKTPLSVHPDRDTLSSWSPTKSYFPSGCCQRMLSFSSFSSPLPLLFSFSPSPPSLNPTLILPPLMDPFSESLKFEIGQLKSGLTWPDLDPQSYFQCHILWPINQQHNKQSRTLSFNIKLNIFIDSHNIPRVYYNERWTKTDSNSIFK